MCVCLLSKASLSKEIALISIKNKKERIKKKERRIWERKDTSMFNLAVADVRSCSVVFSKSLFLRLLSLTPFKNTTALERSYDAWLIS